MVETGLSGDVALIGCDDSTVAPYADPPLPSVRQPTEETGRTMPQVLPAEVEQSTTVRRATWCGPRTLVLRASS